MAVLLCKFRLAVYGFYDPEQQLRNQLVAVAITL